MYSGQSFAILRCFSNVCNLCHVCVICVMCVTCGMCVSLVSNVCVACVKSVCVPCVQYLYSIYVSLVSKVCVSLVFNTCVQCVCHLCPNCLALFSLLVYFPSAGLWLVNHIDNDPASPLYQMSWMCVSLVSKVRVHFVQCVCHLCLMCQSLVYIGWLCPTSGPTSPPPPLPPHPPRNCWNVPQSRGNI